MHIIGRQIIISIFANITSFLLAFVGVKILTNTLSVSEYGIYSLIFFTIGILSIFLDFGFHKYLSTKIPAGEKTKGFSYFTSTFIFETIVLIILSILVIVLGPSLIRYYNFNISSKIIILSTFILMFIILVTETLRFHSFRKRLEFASFMSLFSGKFWILPFFILWCAIQKITLTQVLFLRLVNFILTLFICLWFMGKKGEKIGGNKYFDKEILKEGLIFGTPLIILSLGTNLLASADKYIITYYLSTAAVGYYSLVYTLMNIGYIMSSSIVGIGYYHFAEAYNYGKNDKLKFIESQNIFNCSLKLSLIVGLFICITFALLRSQAIQLMSSKEYLVASKTMLILSPLPVLLTIIYLSQLLLILEKQKRILIGTYIITPILNIILNFILVPRFGINGAAVSTVVSYILICIYFLLKIKIYNVVDISKFYFIKLGVSLFVATIPMYLLNPISIIKLLYTVIISGVIYLVSLIALKIITKNDWYLLWGGKK